MRSTYSAVTLLARMAEALRGWPIIASADCYVDVKYITTF